MEKYPNQFMIRISDELKEKIETDAVDQERSSSFIARKILEKHYGIGKKVKKKRKLSSTGGWQIEIVYYLLGCKCKVA